MGLHQLVMHTHVRTRRRAHTHTHVPLVILTFCVLVFHHNVYCSNDRKIFLENLFLVLGNTLWLQGKF